MIKNLLDDPQFAEHGSATFYKVLHNPDPWLMQLIAQTLNNVANVSFTNLDKFMGQSARYLHLHAWLLTRIDASPGVPSDTYVLKASVSSKHFDPSGMRGLRFNKSFIASMTLVEAVKNESGWWESKIDLKQQK